jgi:hypothetical protein
MSDLRTNRRLRRELDSLVLQQLLEPNQAARLAERYPVEPWDVSLLGRVFSILGVLAAAAGLKILVGAHLRLMLLGEVGLGLAVPGCLLLARYLRRRRGLRITAAAIELAAGLALQGWTVLMAIEFSTGSENWPALVGVQTALLVGLAYLLQNRLVLGHACVVAFFWFGAETGYISGWGAYWLGMNYPARFLLAGLVAIAVGRGHMLGWCGRYQLFARVYLHFGLSVLNLALWFFALFGYFELEPRWDGTESERLAFSLLWALCAGGMLFAGVRWSLRLLRGYGLTFLVINLYTFYFQFVVARSAELWWLHLLLIGGSLVGLGVFVDRWRRNSG